VRRFPTRPGACHRRVSRSCATLEAVAACEDHGSESTRPQAVLLDAYGTLIELDDPVGRLQSALADAGFLLAAETVATAFAAEVRFYRANHDRGGASLRALRRDCAAVFAAARPVTPPGDVAEAVLAAGLRYRSFDDVVPALDGLAEAGCALAVVSNWDASLPGALDEVDLLDRFAVVSVSAVVDSRKPDSAISATPWRA